MCNIIKIRHEVFAVKHVQQSEVFAVKHVLSKLWNTAGDTGSFSTDHVQGILFRGEITKITEIESEAQGRIGPAAVDRVYTDSHHICTP